MIQCWSEHKQENIEATKTKLTKNIQDEGKKGGSALPLPLFT